MPNISLITACVARLSLAACLGFVSMSSFASQCDCSVKVGNCTGAVEFVKGFGSSPSYGAEIAIYSSEKICSKVEYTVDNTPTQTVLVNKNKDTESVFGTNPITASTVRYLSCSVCKNTEQARRDGNEARAVTSSFSGRWIQTERNMFGFTNTSEFDITVTGNSLSGTLKDPQGQVRPVTGTVTGDEARISCSNCVTTTWRLIDPNTITYSTVVGSGTLKKQP